MNYYIMKTENNYGIMCSLKDLEINNETIFKLSEDNYNNLNANISNDKLVYIDESIEPDEIGSKFKLRDKYTKLVDSEWVADEVAIAERNKLILISQASDKFYKYEQYSFGYKYSKLSEQQKTELYVYLDALDNIIKGIDTISTELPTEPF